MLQLVQPVVLLLVAAGSAAGNTWYFAEATGGTTLNYAQYLLVLMLILPLAVSGTIAGITSGTTRCYWWYYLVLRLVLLPVELMLSPQCCLGLTLVLLSTTDCITVHTT